MTPSQLAHSVAGMKDYEERKARERQGNRNDLTSGSIDHKVESGRTSEHLASIAGVGEKTVRRAMNVREKGVPAREAAAFSRAKCRIDADFTLRHLSLGGNPPQWREWRKWR